MAMKRSAASTMGRKKISPREHADREHAAHYVTQSFPVARETWTAHELFSYLRRDTPFEYSNYVYVVNASRKLVGVISLKSILAHPDLPVKKLMKSEVISISPDTRIERVAKLALEHNLRAIPVVKDHLLVGVIETQKILSIINRALREKTAEACEKAKIALFIPPFSLCTDNAEMIAFAAAYLLKNKPKIPRTFEANPSLKL
jgi:Mg/Co/Ni transporter MgtE